MATKAIFYPVKEADVKTYYANAVTQFTNGLATKYGTPAATLASLTASSTNIDTLMQKAFDDEQQAKSSTVAKNNALATAKLDLLRELNRITRLPNWDEADGPLLGIRVQHTPSDPNTAKPVITHITALPEQIILDWVKGDMEGVVIESLVTSGGNQAATAFATPEPPVDNSNPNWATIGSDLKSPYNDTRKNKTGQPEARYYRFRYLKNDMPVGKYSDILQVVAEIY